MTDDKTDITNGGAVCAVCGSRETRPWRTAPDNLLGSAQTFSAVRCVSCGTVRLFPRPSAEAMALHYTPLTYARAEGSDADTELGKRLKAIFAHQARRAVAALGGQDKGTLLDVGCGDGRFLAAMAAHGWSGVGIETDTVAANLARNRSGMTVWETPLETAPILPASFDLVSFLHVLEHVPDPRATLMAAHRALRTGGSILIAVPNTASLEARLFGASWYHLDLPRHFWGFTPHSLVRLVEECGFRVTSLRSLPWLFALQSVRNVMRRLRGRKPQSGDGETVRVERPWQTVLFGQMLQASERWGTVFPGEIMELTAVKETKP